MREWTNKSEVPYIAALLGAVANLDGSTIGWALMGFGLAGAFGNWLAGRVVDRDPLTATAWVAFALAFAMAVFVPAGEKLSGLLSFVVGLWGAAHMAAFVISQARVMRAGRKAAAFALSLDISVCNLGIGLGATLGGRIVDHYGIGAVGYVAAAVVAAALFIAIAMRAARSSTSATT